MPLLTEFCPKPGAAAPLNPMLLMSILSKRRLLLASLTAMAFACLLAAPVVRADDPQEVVFTFQDHKVNPEKLTLPAGKKFKFIIKNLDNTAEEFESVRLNREKVVPAGGQIILLVGPLSAGTYDYFGDFHSDTAKGELTIE